MYVYKSGHNIRPFSGEPKVTFSKGEYLTEKSLGNILRDVFGPAAVQTQYKVGKFKADYFVRGAGHKGHGAAVEFDGYRHYNNTDNVLRDTHFNNECSYQGIEAIRIPYFVQYDVIMPYYFGIGYRPVCSGAAYPCGFIDTNTLHPRDFCILGLCRFILEMSAFPKTIREDVYESMNHLDRAVYEALRSHPVELFGDVHQNIAI